jgi:putative Ca2+/H+ antiporter (TMEM165/GDT1 family)
MQQQRQARLAATTINRRRNTLGVQQRLSLRCFAPQESPMTAFWMTLLFVLMAEMGDKTQLVALAFATRFPTETVLTGVFGATLVVHLFSVGIGEAAGIALPVFWMHLLAGLSFIVFDLWTLRGDTLAEEAHPPQARFGPLLTVGLTFFLAELGDKTMLATMTLASQYPSFLGVWLGSTLGMVIADGLAILVGKVLGKRLPETLIKYSAATLFMGAGIYTLVEAFLAR